MGATSVELHDEASRLRALDGLRFLLATWVVFGHGFSGHPWAGFGHRLSHGAVRVFFALSGFLITALLLREERVRGRIDLRAFYARRALRIFPVYYVAVAMAVVGLLLLGAAYAMTFASAMMDLRPAALAVTHALFIANWTLLPAPTTLDVLWSISVEEQFYLVFPPLLLVVRSGRGRVVLLVAGAAIAFGARLLLALRDPVLAYRSTLACADHLLLGALLAHATHRAPRAWLRASGTVVEVAALAAVVALAVWDPRAPLELALDGTMSALAAVALVAVLARGTGLVSRLLGADVPRRLGERSYAAYVFHAYALAAGWEISRHVAAYMHAGIEVVAPLRTLIALPLAFALAELSYRLVERPFLALKPRFSRSRAEPWPPAGRPGS
jgi:peptidoglycan/LPS O-acetylase OafA/YrhL